MFAMKQQRSQAQNSGVVHSVFPERAKTQPDKATDPLVMEQQAWGNQAMLRFPEPCPLTLPSTSIFPSGGLGDTSPVTVQKKLTINEPGDEYEQEADRIADQVMRMSGPAVPKTPD